MPEEKKDELREKERKENLVVIVNENGEVENHSISPDLRNAFGFDLSKANFRDFLYSSGVLSEEEKDKIWQNYQTNGKREYDKDILVGDRQLHVHFSAQDMKKGRKFSVRDETELTNIKRKLEEIIEHYRYVVTCLGHEIRTPAVTTGGYARQLIAEIEKAKENSNNVNLDYILKGLKIIASAASQSESILKNILEAELIDLGLSSLKKEKIDVYTDVVEPVLETYDIAMALQKKRIAIDHEHSMNPEDSLLIGDKQKCQIIFINPVRNAIRHSPEKRGVISIGVEHFTKFEQYNIYNKGPIILEDVIEKIFDRGYSEAGSSGLGLWISRKMVELHGGKMWAEKGRREGANVIFTLPRE